MRKNYSYFSIVSLMVQIWKACGRNFSPYWNVQLSLNVLENQWCFSLVWGLIYKRFLPRQEAEVLWLPGCLSFWSGRPSDTWQISANSLAKPFPYRGQFLPLCMGEKANETGKTVHLARKTLFFLQLLLFVSFKINASWETKNEGLKEGECFLAFYISFALFFTLSFMFKNKYINLNILRRFCILYALKCI